MDKLKICWSPSSQKENVFLNGLNTNEADECKKIADAADAAVKRTGRFDTIMPWMDTLAQKCAKSDAFGADLHAPIHLNGFDGKVAGTREFCGSFSGSGYKACQCIFKYLAPLSPGTSENIKEDSSLYEIRIPKAPTAYIECEFYDSQGAWIIGHTTEIGEAIAHGVCDFFGVEYIPPKEEKSPSADTPILDDDETLPKSEKDAFRQMLLEVIREDPEAVYSALGDPKYKDLGNLPAWMQKEIEPMLQKGIIDGGTDYATNPTDVNKRKSELTCAVMAARIARDAAGSVKGHWVFVPDEE